MLKQIRKFVLLSAVTIILPLLQTSGQHDSNKIRTKGLHTAAHQDGQHDFDFEIGTWKTHLLLLHKTSTGTGKWTEYNGTTVVHKVWNGRANLVELQADGTSGHIEGLSLRLYNPLTHEWSLNFANSSTGTLSVPTIGKFINGLGEFFDNEIIDGQKTDVRFIITVINPDSCSFEQSFSTDGGKKWVVNWKALDTRIRNK